MNKRRRERPQVADLELNEFISSTNFASPTQEELYEKIIKNHIVFCIGPAGSGKTYISL